MPASSLLSSLQPRRAGRQRPGLVCALAFAILWPGAATTGELAWGDVATPLRIVNLNPFQLLYGVPGSLGAHVMTRGSSELIASMDMASHLIEASPGAERVLIDGVTYRQGLALRHGFGDGWEYLLELSVLSHRAGVLRLSGHATLEIAVTEDDGLHRGAPGIGLEAVVPRLCPANRPGTVQRHAHDITM